MNLPPEIIDYIWSFARVLLRIEASKRKRAINQAIQANVQAMTTSCFRDTAFNFCGDLGILWLEHQPDGTWERVIQLLCRHVKTNRIYILARDRRFFRDKTFDELFRLDDNLSKYLWRCDVTNGYYLDQYVKNDDTDLDFYDSSSDEEY